MFVLPCHLLSGLLDNEMTWQPANRISRCMSLATFCQPLLVRAGEPVSKLPPDKAAKLTRTCQDAQQWQQDRWTSFRCWHHKALMGTMGGRERVQTRTVCYHFPSPCAPQGDLRSALPNHP